MLFQVSLPRARSVAGRDVLDAQLAHCESCLVDARRLSTRSQDVGLDGDVAGVCYPLDLVEEAARLACASKSRT
jgi:hypothetical protein